MLQKTPGINNHGDPFDIAAPSHVLLYMAPSAHGPAPPYRMDTRGKDVQHQV